MSTAQTRPRCAVCDGQPQFDDMDEFTDHVVDEHDAFSVAVINHMANADEVYPDE